MTTTPTRQRPLSDAAFETAKTLLPGGVNSPVRAFKSVGGGTPLFLQKAKGATITDIDGHDYLDYVLSWGPAILGHAHPQVVEAVRETALNGLSFGCPTVLENLLAKAVIDRFPAMETVRFVSSGTEAVMSAIRLARAFTGRKKLIKFEGCYHGHADSLLVKAGSGVATLGIPDSAGISPLVAQETLTAPFNDLEAVMALFEAYGDDIAGVLIEPVAGNMGCVLPMNGFLQGLREMCNAYGSLLIFDEVMTGFRVHSGGVQTLYNIAPDITTLGKIIGGGMPVGAYGGRADIMANVAPQGTMYQAGTLSGNPLGMAAGLKTLQLLEAPNTYETLDANAKKLVAGMAGLCEQFKLPHSTQQVGAMFSLFFVEAPVHNFADVCKTDRAFFNQFFWGMLNRGIYLAPSPFEASFTSVCHQQAEIDATLNAMEDTLRSVVI
ncbi:MAG: glutamate-1-semialdehyde 2,1-aminomutase [Vampirovibrio sp.]|nr:glutamate-1-semialdehyde 2,1-aminomutase [Vampirovibrio sp.]